jgi:hypothetical protein
MMQGTKHMILDWTSALQSALTTLLEKLSSTLPNIIGAILILIVGSIIAMLLGSVVGTGVKKLKIDTALEKTVLYPVSENLGIKISISKLFGELVKWFVLIIVFIAAADVANMSQITDFFNEVLLYLPNVFVAVVILLVASLLATFVSNLITTSFKDELGYLSGIARFAIFTFAVLAAMNQLQISRPLVEILFTGIVATGVLAFGLGGRDVAGDIVKKIYDDFQSRKRK